MKYYSYKQHLDDVTVLRNPHKGWYYHYVDNGFAGPKYRDRVSDTETFSDFPGMHHLYLRFDWIDVEKTEGEFDWSQIDAVMERFAPHGLRFSLRLCTYETGFAATPDWVFQKGADFVDCGRIVQAEGNRAADGINREPNYGDSTYLACLDRLMAAYGARYDGDPRIELVDVGTFGTWGEGHTFFGSRKTFDLDTLMAHLKLHVKYFKKTRVFINDDMLKEAEKHGADALATMLDFCRAHGVGIRDDSIAVDSYAERYGYDTLQCPQYFDALSDRAPVDIECQHCSMTDVTMHGDGFKILEALRRTKATYCGFHGYVDEWLPHFQSFTEYAANRMGYWYFIHGIEMDTLLADCQNEVVLDVENRGFAHAYHPFTLKLALIDTAGKVRIINPDSPDLRTWEGESRLRVPLSLCLDGVPVGEYTLAVGIFDEKTPLLLGLKEALRTSDGFYALQKICVEAL